MLYNRHEPVNSFSYICVSTHNVYIRGGQLLQHFPSPRRTASNVSCEILFSKSISIPPFLIKTLSWLSGFVVKVWLGFVTTNSLLTPMVNNLMRCVSCVLKILLTDYSQPAVICCFIHPVCFAPVPHLHPSALAFTYQLHPLSVPEICYFFPDTCHATHSFGILIPKK